MEKSNKLLLVAYDFPPITSAGMHRIVGMSKYLQRKGWDITVLTVKDSYVHQSGWSMEMIPDSLNVVRTRNFEFRRYRRTLERRISRRAEVSGTSANRHKVPKRPGLFGLRILSGVLGRLDGLFAFPDPKIGWFFPLLWKAWRLIRTNKYDVVLSSSPPHSLHLPLLLLRRVFRFRWVVDFRDPWTIPDRMGNNGLSFRLLRTIEKHVLENCDWIVANTEGNGAAIAEVLGQEMRGKLSVVTNGFDEELLVQSDDDDVAQDCDIVYGGEVYPRMLDVYIEAIRFIAEQRLSAVPRLWIFGALPSLMVRKPIADNKLGPYIHFAGRVTYKKILQILDNATALLLLVPHGTGFETWVPSKLYTYLFTSTPILVIGPRGDATRIVEQTGRGMGITCTNPREAAEQILDFFQQAREGDFQGRANRDRLSKYKMEYLAERMHWILQGTEGIPLMHQ